MQTFKLVITSGAESGRKIEVKEGTSIVGRSEKCDIVLRDPSLSRRQCEITLADGTLTIRDLGSVNGTFVNDKNVIREKLSSGDGILIGDTTLLVEITDDFSAANEVPAKAPEPVDGVISFDLGLPSSAQAKVGAEESFAAPKSAPLRPLLFGIAAVAILLLIASFILKTPAQETKSTRGGNEITTPVMLPLVLEYEKVEADANSAFRYEMTLAADGTLAVKIDDLAENRHIRQEAKVNSNLLESLADEIERGGFFSLAESYEGVAKENTLTSYDICVVLGNRRIGHVRVENRTEPPEFREVRENLETFGKNELGIWAIQFSGEKLIELSYEAFTRARRLFDERTSDYGNNFAAIKSFKEAEVYLETIDPKPDFFQELLAEGAKATQELESTYEMQQFVIQRALKMKEWANAKKELQILCEIIPDRSDPRNETAMRQLLDVEARIRKEK